VPAGLSIVAIVDDQTDRGAIETHAKQLAAATAPGLSPTVVVEVGAVRPQLAKLGPFTVDERSKTPLKATLAIALLVIAALAGWIALVMRRRPTAADPGDVLK